MRKRVSMLIASIFALLPLLLMVPQVYAQFNPLDPSCLNEAGERRPELANSELCNDADVESDPLSGTDGTITKTTNLLALGGGIIAVIILVVAGIQMIVSTGDAGKVKSSRDTILYAAVGIIVIVLARAIVIFVVNNVG